MLESVNGSCTKVDKVLSDSDPSTPSPSLPRIPSSSPDVYREESCIQYKVFLDTGMRVNVKAAMTVQPVPTT